MSKDLVKHNANFLEYPLWFQDDKLAIRSEEGFSWKDIAGYVYHSGYRIPTKTDGIFLLYFLLQSQKRDYAQEISLTRYQALKDCGLSISQVWYDRLEESLNRWLRVDISFQGKFYDGKEYLHKAFHIIEAWEIEKKSKQLKIQFSSNFLKMMQSRGFFKYINFHEFKALRSPLATRLYEILSKNFIARDEWPCDAVKLAEKIPMNERFPADIIPKIRSSLNRINKHTSSNFVLEIRRSEPGKAILVFKKLADNPKPVVEAAPKPAFQMPEDENFKNLVAMIPRAMREHKTILEMVLQAFKTFGYQYVARNIQYTNINAKKNYRSYLSKTLSADYGIVVEEDEMARQVAEQERKQSIEALDKKRQSEVMQQKIEQEKAARAKVFISSLSAEALAKLREDAFSSLDSANRELVNRKSSVAEMVMKLAMNKLVLDRMKIE